MRTPDILKWVEQLIFFRLSWPYVIGIIEKALNKGYFNAPAHRLELGRVTSD